MAKGTRMAGSNDDDGKVKGPLSPGQRWSVQRKREVVLRILRGESIDAISREVGVPIARLEKWRDGALAGMEAGLRERGADPRDEELDSVKAKLGEALMENELLRVKAGRTGPFGIKRWKR
jgi:transposase-like protein